MQFYCEDIAHALLLHALLHVNCRSITFWSLIVLKVLDFTIGLRVSREEEKAGLDASIHGETIVRVAADQGMLDSSVHNNATVNKVASSAPMTKEDRTAAALA